MSRSEFWLGLCILIILVLDIFSGHFSSCFIDKPFFSGPRPMMSAKMERPERPSLIPSKNPPVRAERVRG